MEKCISVKSCYLIIKCISLVRCLLFFCLDQVKFTTTQCLFTIESVYIYIYIYIQGVFTSQLQERGKKKKFHIIMKICFNENMF